MKTFILVTMASNAMTQKFDRGTWIAAKRAKVAPTLGRSEIGHFEWREVPYTLEEINEKIAAKSNDPNFGGYKQFRFSSRKPVYTRDEVDKVPETKVSRRGNAPKPSVVTNIGRGIANVFRT